MAATALTYEPFKNNLDIDLNQPVYLVDVDDTLVKNKFDDCPYDDELIKFLNRKQVFLFTKMNEASIEEYSNNTDCSVKVNRYNLIQYLKSQGVIVKAVITPSKTVRDSGPQQLGQSLPLGGYYSEYLRKLEFNLLSKLMRLLKTMIQNMVIKTECLLNLQVYYLQHVLL